MLLHMTIHRFSENGPNINSLQQLQKNLQFSLRPVPTFGFFAFAFVLNKPIQ